MGEACYVPELPVHMKRFDGAELARGHFDEIACVKGDLIVIGWMLLPDKALDSVSVFWNGELIGSAELELRPDVASAFLWIPHAERSGFRFRLHMPMVEVTEVGWLDVLGCEGGRPVARMSTLFRADLDAAVLVPPQKLMERVTGNRDAWFFRIGGLKSFSELLEPISQHRELRSIRRLLDWGCGCGRVSTHFLHFLSGPEKVEIFGCDIDPRAIAWCSDHLQGGNFLRIDPWPPTPYENATFDVVVGVSVFTHLARDVQDTWLAEMRRVIVPGGLFLASTHGLFAARFAFPGTFTELLRDEIFYDIHIPPADRILPDGYYRNVYQTREYTLRKWSRHFEIVEYIERGLMNHQDLVVMRRPA